MKCPRCQHDNPPQANFCLECGARVALTCTKCRSELPAGAKFCLECGEPVASRTAGESRFASPEAYTPKHLAEKILTSASALEGERKQVTVLFVDVSGFTSLAERRDPEEVHRLMRHAFDLMLAEVHRYEGTVNQFLGDGIMALFGAPIAHEDHARRAALAALAVKERSEIGVRIGINSGSVVVGAIGDDLRMDYTASGDTTVLAARLHGAARPGDVLVSTASAGYLRGYFDLQETEPVTVNERPVHALRVIGR